MQRLVRRARAPIVRLVATFVGIIAASVALSVRDLPRTAAAVPAPVIVPAPTPAESLPPGYTAPPTNENAGLQYGGDPTNVLDLYLPKDRPLTLLPVIVFLHSGGWVAGSRADVPAVLLRQVSRAGIALASVDYRLARRKPDGTEVNAFPAAPEDVDRAVRWLKAMGPVFGLDPSRIVLAGDSAGGHLAALAAAAPGAFTATDLPPALAAQDPAVTGVIDFVGPSDLAAMAATGPFGAGIETAFLGCAAGRPATCNPALVEAADVAPHLTAGAPPAFLAYGRDDTLVVPATQGRPLADQWARRAGGRGIWYEEVDDGHNLSPAKLNVAALERWLDADLAGTLG